MIGSHITPESYLSSFARVQTERDRKAKVWVYERGKLPRTSTPERIGKENGYFAVTRPDGSIDESMETDISILDGKAAAIMRLMRNEAFVVSSRDKETLTQYVALMFARSTARRDLSTYSLAQIRAAYEQLSLDMRWLGEQATEYGAISGRIVTEEQVSVATRQVLVKLENPGHVRNMFVQTLMGLSETIAGELANKPWQIWEAPNSSKFITTDNPVITFKPDNRGSFLPGWGFRTPGLITLFPYSPNLCLAIGAIGRYWRLVTSQTVQDVNKGLAMLMNRWSYSVSKSSDTEYLVNVVGGTVRYGKQAFVSRWASDSPEAFRSKVWNATKADTSKLRPQGVRAVQSAIIESN